MKESCAHNTTANPVHSVSTQYSSSSSITRQRLSQLLMPSHR